MKTKEYYYGKKVRVKNNGCRIKGCLEKGTEGILMESSMNNYDYNFIINGCEIGFHKNEFDIYLELIEDNMENKKIIGYKLKDEKFLKSVGWIAHPEDGEFSTIFYETKTLYLGNSVDRLREAGVLDLWFEPVYEQQFKVGDYVLLSNNARGWGALSEEVENQILQITKIDLLDRKDDGGRYYFGKLTTVGKEIVRLATEEEIDKVNNVIIEANSGVYKLEVKNDYVKFGCQEIRKSELEAIKTTLLVSKRLIDHYNLLEAVRNNEVNVELIDKILNKL